MANIPNISFGKLLYREHEGGGTFAENYENVSFGDFSAYAKAIADHGFSLQEEHSFGCNTFKTFTSAEETLFLSYYPSTGGMTLVQEPGTRYLSFSDNAGDSVCVPSLTHIDIKSYGLSYIIKLSDCRFIVFDGGWNNDDSADKLFDELKKQSISALPRIAAWIFTHPHGDHYRCFQLFWEKYKNAVVIEKIILNFPDCSSEDETLYPPLFSGTESSFIKKFNVQIRETGAEIHRAHSGQIYNIGDAHLEILSSPDDTLFTPVGDINHLSLVVTTEICGQKVMWCADADFEAARLAERYGEYLKCDIVSLTHHGYCGGRKKDYTLMNPSVCLAPVLEWDCLSYIDIHFDFNRYLFRELNLQKLICGGRGNTELQLPYYPPASSRGALLDAVDAHLKALGANDWYFTDVPCDSLCFTFVNSAYYKTAVYADFIFENSAENIYFVKFSVPGRSSTPIDILSTAKNGAEDFFGHPVSDCFADFAKKGKCSVHFSSDIPIVISGEKPAAYFK